jgi:hypothetical protein
MWHEDDIHGQGTFAHSAGWSYTGALERDRPTHGELTEADGRRFTVTYAKTCDAIFKSPKPKTKVGGDAVLEWAVCART